MDTKTQWRVRGTKKGGLPVLVEKRPKGKSVTVISNVERPHLLLAKLQRTFGTGGSVQGFSKCELQGDQAARVRKWLCASAPPSALVDVRASERVLHGGVVPDAGRYAARRDDTQPSAAGNGTEHKVRSKPRWTKARKDAAGAQLDVRDTRCSFCSFYYCSGCDGNRTQGDPVWALLSDEYTDSHELFAPPAMSLGRGRSRHACQTKEHVDAALDQIGMLAGMAPVAQQRAAAIKASLSRTSHVSRKLECNTWGTLAPVAEAVASTVRPSVSTASCAAANADMKRYIARRAHEQRQRKIAVRRAASHARPPAPIVATRPVLQSGRARRTCSGRRRYTGGARGKGASNTGTCPGHRVGPALASNQERHGGRKACKLVSLDDFAAYHNDYDDCDYNLNYDDDYAYEGVGNDGNEGLREPLSTCTAPKTAPDFKPAAPTAPRPVPRVPESWQMRDDIIADVLPHGDNDFLWDVYLSAHGSGIKDEDAFLRALEASIERAHAREDEDEAGVDDEHEEGTAVENAHAEAATMANSGVLTTSGEQRTHMRSLTGECCDAAICGAASDRHTDGNVDQLWHFVHQHGWDVRFCDTLGDILPRRSDFLWDVFVDAWSRGAAEDDAFNAALQCSLDVVHQREQQQEQGKCHTQKDVVTSQCRSRPDHWPAMPTVCAECGSQGPLEEDVDNRGVAYCLVCWDAYHDQQELKDDMCTNEHELDYRHQDEHNSHADAKAAMSHYAQPSDAEQHLCGMGFSASSVAAALAACDGDEGEAVEMLLSG